MINPFRALKALRQQGILGMNRRNAEYIQTYNPRASFPLVDNKLKTKTLAQAQGLPIPTLLAVIHIEHQIKSMATLLADHSQFVIKPAQGSGGDGIVVISGRSGDLFIKSDGSLISLDALGFHVSNILSGMYSLGGHPDVAMVEERVISDPLFTNIIYQGLPDIRVIVFLGYPVMAMVRLPTQRSHGKANLHQGAVGVGIHLPTGRTTTAVHYHGKTNKHPDTGAGLSNILIPSWKEILTLSAGCYELTRLGFLGVDIVLDERRGPLMLELNARPGLAIQIANRQGLIPRLECIKNLGERTLPPSERVNFLLSHPLFI